jgi:hypothetical protein
MNELTSAPVAVITSVSASDIDRNSSVTVTFSTNPFGQSFPETIIVYGIHPTLILVLHYDVDRRRYQIIKMDLGTLTACHNGSPVSALRTYCQSTQFPSTSLRIKALSSLKLVPPDAHLSMCCSPRMIQRIVSQQLAYRIYTLTSSRL